MTELMSSYFSNIQRITEAILTSVPAIGEDEITFHNLIVGLAVNGLRDVPAAEITTDGKNSTAVRFS